MAGKRTLAFEILAETKKGTKDLSKMRGELIKLDKSIKASKRSAKGFSLSFGKLSTVTAQFLSVSAAIRGVSSAITTIADFEVQIDRLGAVSKASADELTKLEEESKRLGKTTQFTASQVAESMNYLAMAGFSVDEILSSTEGVLNLATIGMLDLGEAADITSNILTGFGLSAEETDRVVDVLAETITSSNTNVQELGSAMSKVAPVAASLNMSLEETAAALGVMADAGIKAELAGTQLKVALIQLATDSKAKAALKDMGVSAYDTEGNFKGLTQIVKEMKPALAEMSQEARNTALVDVFGKRSIASANIFIDKLDSIEKKYKDNAAAAGTAKTMAEIMAGNLTGAFKEFMSSLEAVTLEFSDTLIPILEEALDASTEWLRSLDENDIANVTTIIKGLASMIALVVDTITLLNDVLLPDWMTGKDGAGLAGTVLVGWALVFTEVGKSVTTMGNKLDAAGDQWDRLTERAEESKDLMNQANMFDGSLESFNKLQDAIIKTTAENKKLIEEWKKKDPKVYGGLVNNLTYKTKLLEESLTKLKTIKPYEEQIKATKEVAKATETLTTTTKKLTEEEIKALDKLNKQRVKDHTKALKTLEKDEEKLTKEILKANEKLAKDLAGIEDDRLKSKVDIQGQISELERSGLSDKDAYYKKEEDADKLVSDAKRALIDGDLEAYRTYFEAAKSLIDENGDKAITKNGAILVSADEVRKNSIDSLKELGGLEDQYYDKKKSMAQMEHDQKISFKKMEIELVKLNIEAELELIKLSSQPKGTPLDTTALDSVLAKIDGLNLGLSTLRDMPVKLNVDSQTLDEVPAKVEALKMTLNGITMTVNADTTPADFDIDKMVTDASGKEIVMAVNPEWEKAEKEIEKSLKPKPVEVPVKVDAKSFSKEVDTAKATAQTPVVTPVQADTTQAQSQVRVLKAAIALPSSFLVVADASAAVSVIAQLKVPTSSTHTIYVDKVYNNASGGYAGEPLNRAEGGAVYRTIPHGKIPGHDLTGRDDVRVNATRGEYFLNVGATDYAGGDFLNAVNAKLIPRSSIDALMASTSQSLATGGEVGAAPARNISLNFMDDNGAAMETMTDEMTASKIEKYFRKYAK